MFNFMQNKTITYTHWRTGQEVTEDLTRDPKLTITSTHLICPFDDTHILQYSAEVWKRYECPNCKTIYSLKTHTQKAVDIFAKQHFVKLLPKLHRLNEDKQNLVARIDKAVKRGIIAQSQP